MAIKILIIDDEPAIGRLLEYQLTGLGYQAAYESDPINGLQRVSFERPDLVLLDVMMPQISGWEVCRNIRATNTVPIIMLTAKDAEADVIVGLSSGADDYLTKPFSIDHLKARIEAVLRRANRQPAPQPALEQLPRHLQQSAATQRTTTPAQQPAAAAGAAARQRTTADPIAPGIGRRLRTARQMRGITLYDAGRRCMVSWEYLQAIEQENWSYIPVRQRTAAVTTYMQFLGVDAQPSDGARGARSQYSVWFVVALVIVSILAAAVAFAVSSGMLTF
jgi:DNA-binding response OmpR family regulator